MSSEPVPEAGVLSAAAERYVTQVRFRLDDLPARERASSVDALVAQLHGIERAGGYDDAVAIVSHLGTPSRYAGEVREARGHPPRVGAGATSPDQQVVRFVVAVVAVVLFSFFVVGVYMASVFSYIS